MKTAENYYYTILLKNPSQNIIDNIQIQTLEGEYQFGPHMHSTVEIIVCQKGTCDMKIHQTELVLHQGEYLVLLQNRPHSCCVTEGETCELLQMHFHANIFMELFTDTLREHHLFFLLDLCIGRKWYLKGKCSTQLYQAMYFLCEESKNREDNFRVLMELYFSQILLLLSRDVEKDQNNKDPIVINRHLLCAYEYMKENYKDRVSVDEIASYCGISSRQLRTLFQKYVGMSVSTYLTYYRIERAVSMMLDTDVNRTLTEVALDCGFGSLSYFSRVFKNTMGLSPAKYVFKYKVKKDKCGDKTSES